jgi:hypothetical protein
VPGGHPSLPQSATLEVSPNPFNAIAVLQLTVREPGMYHVDLYNSLGQRVRRIWSGNISGEKQIVLTGEGLASGVYFVRVTEMGVPAAMASAKVVLLK